ncbi:MAG: NAD(P)-dependent oxidoreductase [Candidatus Micrarchaeota archaeon]|nr:NAD(P)-dependent oxidoreductase [Candidatus Micrarchaeota archaeon]
MRVFVAGNLGYIGTTLSAMLHERGYEVIGCDCGYFSDGFIRGNLKDFVAENMKKQIYKDVRDISKSDLAGCDAVVDYSGLANDPACDLNPEWTEEINHRAPVRLARLAKASKIGRFVFASSCSIYGKQPADRFATEESPLVPLSAYAKAKIGVEKDVRLLASRAFAPVFLRNATVFGVSYRQRFDLVVNNLTGWAYTTGKVKLLSAGTSWRPSLHVKDAARAVIAAIESPHDAVCGESFNIGMDSENYKVIQIAEMVKEIVPNCELEVGKQAPIDPRSYRVSFKKARERLPLFKPEITVKRGIGELYEFFKEIGLDYKTFSEKRFYDVEAIKGLIAKGQVDGKLRLRKRR